jgi:hypothetical protein
MRGDKNLNWIIGIVKKSGLGKGILQETLAIYHKTYARNQRFQDLEKKCKEIGVI